MRSDQGVDTGRAVRPAPGGTTRGERHALVGLAGYAAVALVGYATYGRHPSLLDGAPSWAQSVYGEAFGVFAQVQVVLSGAVLGWVLVRRAGGSWLTAFALMYGLSLAVELAGTTWGVPFGAYRYGAALGPQWLGRVPALIPLSWFYMAVPSYALARLVARGVDSRGRVALGSLILLSWDLSLDPAMSYVTRYWFWAEQGAYYGMPLLNLGGWYVTGLALCWVLHALRAERWVDALPMGWVAGFFGVNLLFPLVMNAVAGLVGAVLLALAAVAAFGLAVRLAVPGRRSGIAASSPTAAGA